MKVELTRPQIKKLRMALYLAEEWEESLIDAYTYTNDVMDNKIVVSRCKRNIASFRNLSDKFRTYLKK